MAFSVEVDYSLPTGEAVESGAIVLVVGSEITAKLDSFAASGNAPASAGGAHQFCSGVHVYHRSTMRQIFLWLILWGYALDIKIKFFIDSYEATGILKETIEELRGRAPNMNF